MDSGELPLLEFLIRPQPKESYGVYGGGWERPGDVFSAAKRLKKHLEREENQCTHGHSYYGNTNLFCMACLTSQLDLLQKL